MKVVLHRECGKRTNSETILRQLEYIVIQRGLGSNRGNGWSQEISCGKPTLGKKGLWNYKAEVTLTKEGGQKDKKEKQFLQILKYIIEAGKNAKFNKYPWNVIEPTKDFISKIDSSPMLPESDEDKNYASISMEPGCCFDHIYDREPQIAIVQSALEAFLESDMQNRFHSVLYGPPGCGKSAIALAFADMLGKENEAYMKMDATSTTAAGAAKILLEAPIIPPVLIVEEIEKTDDKSLHWLLGVLDQRGEIRKTNYRIGHQARNVKMLCIATVNDMELFSKVMSGALASRFPNKLYCDRPSRKILQKILEREVLKVDGNMAWIEPALKFGYDDMKEDDPRTLIPICLCGRDRLLTGEYQEWLLKVSDPATRKDRAVSNKKAA